MNQKTLILVFAVLFMFCASVLFAINARGLAPDRVQNWWTLSFDAPSDPESLAFTVVNHSDQTAFTYQILAQNTDILDGTFSLPRGETRMIAPPTPVQTNVRMRIVVSSGTDKKEIYR